MRFASDLGGYTQTRGGECKALVNAGLVTVHQDVRGYSLEPTPHLRSLFLTGAGAPLEILYPLLVEFVMFYEYRDWPDLVDLKRVECLLRAEGMTESGLETLHTAIAAALGPRAYPRACNREG